MQELSRLKIHKGINKIRKVPWGKSQCPICENFRFLILDDEPVPCGKCNPKGKYKVVNEERCLGCDKVDCLSCPAGTYKALVKQ